LIPKIKLLTAGVFLPVNPMRFEPAPNANDSGSYPLKGVDKNKLLPITERRTLLIFLGKTFVGTL
jgi:hypothetical protein